MTDTKPSKSARKRAAQEIKALGEQLLGLSEQEVSSLGLDERLVEAIEQARRIKSREALRRQKQYLAKLLMSVDTAPIEALIEERESSERRNRQRFKSAERWRDRLVSEKHAALDALAALESNLGRKLPELADLVDALERSQSDRQEKTIQRSIFRSVFDALGNDELAQVAERADDR